MGIWANRWRVQFYVFRFRKCIYEIGVFVVTYDIYLNVFSLCE